MKNSWWFLISVMVGIVLAMGVAPVAYAQDASAEFTLDEIIITAERRERSVQDSPIAVSALDSESLDEQDIGGIVDLQMRMPSTTFLSDRVYIRGVGRAITDLASDPAVGIFYDGAYNEYLTRLDDMVDVQRVETVRGPQSTLYGRNTIGGAINVIFAKPTKEFSGQAKARIGNYEKREFTLILNSPLIGEWLLGRISLTDNYYGGHVKNLVYNEYIGTEDNWKVNFKLLFEPTDNFSMYFQYKVLYESDNSEEEATSLLPYADEDLKLVGGNYQNALYNAGINPNQGGRTPWVSNANYIGMNRLDSKEVSLATDFSAGNFTVKHQMFYRWWNNTTDNDYDNGPVKETQYIYSNVYDTHTWAQDLQLMYGGEDSPISLMAGLYYFFTDKNSTSATYRRGSGYWEYGYDHNFGSGYVAKPLNQTYENETLLQNTSKSAYLDLTYQITDKLNLTLGGRYNIDEKETQEDGWVVSFTNSWFGEYYYQNDQYIADNNITDTTPSHANGYYWQGIPYRIDPWPGVHPTIVKKDWVANTWRAGIDYKWSDESMTYFTISRGYKPGGIAIATYTGKADIFDAEYLLSYEAGWKTQWLDNRIQSTLSIYYYDFEGKQINYTRGTVDANGESVTESLTTNASGSENYGLELEGSAFITKQLRASLQYSYMIAEYSDLKDVYDSNSETLFDLSGNKMAMSPEHKVTLSGSYTYPTDYGDFILQGTYMWQDETVFSMWCRSEQWAKPWDRLDAQVMWYSPDYKWRVSVWGKNIFDHASAIYVSSTLEENSTPDDLSTLTHSLVDPFQFGIEVSYKW